MASLIWVPLLLGSCLSHKTDYFVAGKFEAFDDSVSYYLEVSEISKSTYASSGRTNTVKDVVIDKYFSVQFYECVGGESILVDLINLKDENPGVGALPSSYIDDHGVKIMPRYPNGLNMGGYYLMVYKSLDLFFKEAE